MRNISQTSLYFVRGIPVTLAIKESAKIGVK